MLEDSSPPMDAVVAPPCVPEDMGIPVYTEPGTPQPAPVVQQELRDLMKRILEYLGQEQAEDTTAQYLNIYPLLTMGDTLLVLTGLSLLGKIPMEIRAVHLDPGESPKRTVGRLPVWAWRQVTFYPNTSEQRAGILDTQRMFERCNVRFDYMIVADETGPVSWHLDRSYRFLLPVFEDLQDGMNEVKPEDH